MKKIVYIMVVVLLLSVFSACQQSENQTGDAANTETETPTQQAETAPETDAGQQTGIYPYKEEITIRYMIPLNFAQWPLTKEGLENSYAFTRLRELTNIRIDFEIIEADAFSTVLTSRFASGKDIPDVIEFLGWSGGGTVQPLLYQKAIEDGIALPLNDLYEKYAPDLFAQFHKDPTAWATIAWFDNNLYHFSQFSTPDLPFVSGRLVWDTKAVKEAGYTPGEQHNMTTDDFYDMLVKMKQNGIKYPFFVQGNEMMIMANSFGITGAANGFLLDDNDKVINSYTDPRYKDYLAYLRSMYEEGLLHPEFDVLKQDQWIPQLVNGEIGVLGKGHGWPMDQYLVDAGKLAEADDARWLPLNPPLTGPYGDRYFDYGLGIASMGPMITSASKYPEEIFQLLLHMFNHEEPWNTDREWGEPGVDHTVLPDGTRQMVGPREETMPKRGVPFYFFSEIQELEPWLKARLPNPNNKKEVQYYKAQHVDWLPKDWDGKSIPAVDRSLQTWYKPQLPNTRLTAEESEIYAQYVTDVMSFVNESSLRFIKGEDSLDNFDNYVQTLKSIGMDELIKVKQSMYDRFVDMTQ